MRTQMLFAAVMVCLLGVGLANVGAQGSKKPEPQQPPDEMKIAKPKFLPMQAAPAPTQWEYRILSSSQIYVIGKDNFEAGFNKLGAESWELAGIEPREDKYHVATYIFRRPAAARPKAEPNPDAKPAPKEKAEERFDFRVYSLKFANAIDVANVLEQLMRTGKQDPWRIVAEPHSNQLLVKGSPDIQIAIETILRHIDVLSADALQPPGPGKKKK